MMSSYSSRGRSNERGGRGRGRNTGRGRGRFNPKTSNISKTQERELKFSPMNNQGKTNAATYTTTRDAIIQHIRKNYKGGIDVGKSLEDMSKVDLDIL